VEIRTSLDATSDPLASSVVQTTFCPKETQIFFPLDKSLLLNPSQTYYLGMNASAALYWTTSGGASNDTSYNFVNGSSIPMSGEILLFQFNGECYANSDCHDTDNMLPAGTSCGTSPVCYTPRVCNGITIECPVPVLQPDGTPCAGGFLIVDHAIQTPLALTEGTPLTNPLPGLMAVTFAPAI